MLETNQRTQTVGGSRSEYAYQEIRQRLLSGRWKPGEQISTYALAEELQISRTPVSEALKRLAAEGIIDIIPQVGCVVRVPRPEEIEETFLIRAALEGLAAERAATQIGESDIQALESIIKAAEDAAARNDAIAYESLNRTFHDTIAQISGLTTLRRLLVNLWQLSGHQTGNVAFFAGRFRISISEHRRILEYLKQHDTTGARQMTEEHLRRCATDFAQFVQALRKEG
jgi:GntR family transcriptional regulator, rspAB operon transcriptional repressor